MELVCSKKLELGDNVACKAKKLNLEYYLVACVVENCCSYGIQINMTNDIGELESTQICDILTSRASILDLITLLYSNSVTPISAHDVIYDCIA